MLNSLSGRFLILTAVFVMLAEVMIFVPSVARYREDFLLSRLERSQIASLALLADEMIDADLEEELLRNAGVYNIVLRRDAARQLVLSSPVPGPVSKTFDLRDATGPGLIRDAMVRLATPETEMIRVIGMPVRMGGLLIEVTMETGALRAAMIDYGLRILVLSAVISFITAVLLFLAVRVFLVKPIKRVVGHMQSYAAAPEDAHRIIRPSAGIKELREAEDTLQQMQTQLTARAQAEGATGAAGGGGGQGQPRPSQHPDQRAAVHRPDRDEPGPPRQAGWRRSWSIHSPGRCTCARGRWPMARPRNRRRTLSRFALRDIVEEVIDSERLSAAATPRSPSGRTCRPDLNCAPTRSSFTA